MYKITFVYLLCVHNRLKNKYMCVTNKNKFLNYSDMNEV